MTEAQFFTPEELVERFITLESLIHRHFQKNRMGHGPGSNPHKGQGRVLSLLNIQPVITQKELSFLLDMRPQSLGELLGKLENAGFITREPSAEDRRVMTITLTEAGKQAAEDLVEPQAEQPIFGHLDEAEQQQFGELMTKLITGLEAELPEDLRRRRGGFGHGPGHFEHRMDKCGGHRGGSHGPGGHFPPGFDGHFHNRPDCHKEHPSHEAE